MQAEGEIKTIIYGAGIVGQAVEYILRTLRQRAAFFIDDNPNIKTCRNLNVFRPEELAGEYIIIMAVADAEDAENKLRANEQLEAEVLPCVELLTTFPYDDCHFAAEKKFVEYVIDTTLACQIHRYYFPEKKFLHSVDLIITERCSLHCKDCSNLMQYYKEPKDDEVNDLMIWLKALTDQYDMINEVRIIGGEPFMHKYWDLITRGVLNNDKIRFAVIYTNGTIAPSFPSLVVSPKLMVMITDYGKLSKNLDKLVDELKSKHIAYHVIKPSWSECGVIKQHNRHEEENAKLFKDCCVHNLKTLSKGVLYKCPFEANLVRLGYQFVDACDYCNGRPYGAKEIPVAVQK